MSVNTFPAPEVYRDPKRWAWWFSLGVPALIGLGPLLMLWQGNPLMLLWPLVFLYLAVPLADALLGEERSNPPESAVAQLEADAYYRFITYALVPVLWGAFVFAAWFVASHDLLALVCMAGHGAQHRCRGRFWHQPWS